MTQRRNGPIGLGIVAVLTGALLIASPAGAATSRSLDGVTLTVAVLEPSADGTIRGAIRVELQPGWKTYWIDPGQSGIPASYAFAGATARLFYPAPHRFGEGVERANGYSAPFSVAFTLEPDKGTELPVEMQAMLGVCRDICIPVSAAIATRPSAADASLVDAAFAALPATAPGDPIAGASLSSDAKVLTLVLPASRRVPPDKLFVSGPDGWYFGEAGTGVETGGMVTYAVPVLGKPRKGPALSSVDLVLAGPQGSIEQRDVAVESLR